MKASRRQFLRGAALAGTTFATAGRVQAARRESASAVVTPDLPSLPHTLENGVKVFHVTAEPVKRRIVPFKTMDVWGYNGTSPGPAIQVNQGDRVRIVFENRLPESTTIHWHGLEVPIEMDGVPYISQPPVPPGGRFVYEFTLHQEGTYFYHAHGAMQEMMGLIGLFLIHPRTPHRPAVDHDYGIILQGWAILPSSTVPNTAGMEFNWLTFNGVSGPSTTPLLARQGSRVRIRIVNLGMDHHPIHLHGHQFVVTGTEGGRAPESTWFPGNTVLVGVAQARDIEFDAVYPGDWMLHCHLPHHMMNSMSDLLQDRMISTAATNEAGAQRQMQAFSGAIGAEHAHHPAVASDASSVPGFPQDAFMEMGMDAAVAKPENAGLAPNWSAGMMGMMSMVRVLPEARYDEIVSGIGGRS
jgi:FtsP/CotA-like multicopper oxidase with cupredoxin domain